jgi:hypothetical protein
MLFLPRDFLVLEKNPMKTWDFKREGFAEIWILAGRLLGLAWFTPQMKESLGADTATSLG